MIVLEKNRTPVGVKTSACRKPGPSCRWAGTHLPCAGPIIAYTSLARHRRRQLRSERMRIVKNQEYPNDKNHSIRWPTAIHDTFTPYIATRAKEESQSQEQGQRTKDKNSGRVTQGDIRSSTTPVRLQTDGGSATVTKTVKSLSNIPDQKSRP
ncbi:hypothetical protein KIN20_017586 [Parelaphostrongylus tenuis]|uniref:Uncharacterized protein n=1 Tax=Parelaphostrongylus tenuis TaxID=148309 RepID=A0AAD5N2Q2_PARTN|nr:hypothetical protein KIN20_017586 [Parelaphostrongylus tenuis]